MANAQDIGRHQFAAEDRLFFDTNIWLLLFDCRSDPNLQTNPQASKIYSGAFAGVVASNTRSLLSRCQLIEDGLNRATLTKCLANFADDACDINDEFIVALCDRHNLKMVTNDGDFNHSELNILTANSSYLKR